MANFLIGAPLEDSWAIVNKANDSFSASRQSSTGPKLIPRGCIPLSVSATYDPMIAVTPFPRQEFPEGTSNFDKAAYEAWHYFQERRVYPSDDLSVSLSRTLANSRVVLLLTLDPVVPGTGKPVADPRLGGLPARPGSSAILRPRSRHQLQRSGSGKVPPRRFGHLLCRSSWSWFVFWWLRFDGVGLVGKRAIDGISG